MQLNPSNPFTPPPLRYATYAMFVPHTQKKKTSQHIIQVLGPLGIDRTTYTLTRARTHTHTHTPPEIRNQTR